MDMASQCGRWSTDGTAELRGNGMLIRRERLEAVGGWSPTALTEDLEMSTRLTLHGEHVALAPEVTVVEEAVESAGRPVAAAHALGGGQPATADRARARRWSPIAPCRSGGGWTSSSSSVSS